MQRLLLIFSFGFLGFVAAIVLTLFLAWITGIGELHWLVYFTAPIGGILGAAIGFIKPVVGVSRHIPLKDEQILYEEKGNDEKALIKKQNLKKVLIFIVLFGIVAFYGLLSRFIIYLMVPFLVVLGGIFFKYRHIPLNLSILNRLSKKERLQAAVAVFICNFVFWYLMECLSGYIDLY